MSSNDAPTMLKPEPFSPVAPPAGPSTRRLYESGGWRLGFNAVGALMAVLAAFVAAVVGVTLLPPGTFLAARNVDNMLSFWLIRAIMVPPIVLIVAGGGLDLSVGAVLGLTGVIVAVLAPEVGVGAAVVSSLGLALLIGLVNGALAGGTRLHGALVTVAMGTLARGLALRVTEGQVIVMTGLKGLSNSALPWGLVVVSAALGLVFAFVLMARKPRPKPGDDTGPRLARLFFTGVPYVLSSLMAALAGLVYLSRMGAGMGTAGSGMEVEQILIALMGGVPLVGVPMAVEALNILGALVAAVAVTEAQNFMNLAGSLAFTWEAVKGAGLVGVGVVSSIYYGVASIVGGRE